MYVYIYKYKRIYIKSLGTYTRTNAKFAKVSVDFMILQFVL